MNRKDQLCTLHLSDSAGSCAPAPVECPTHRRLAKSFARLRNIELVRNHRSDPEFGKTAEDRIIWRELLELELQEISGQLDA